MMEVLETFLKAIPYQVQLISYQEIMNMNLQLIQILLITEIYIFLHRLDFYGNLKIFLMQKYI